MAQALAAHKGESEWTEPGDPVFASLDGRPLDYSNVRRRAVLPAKEASGIEWPKGKAFHLFRSTAATLFHHRGNASTRELADVLGHADPAFTTRVYVGLSDRPAEGGFLDEVLPVGGQDEGKTRAMEEPQTAANGGTSREEGSRSDAGESTEQPQTAASSGPDS